MKRVSHIWEKIISKENIKKAIEKVCESHRWLHYPDKPNKTVVWIESDLDARIEELINILENGFEQGECKKKRRYDINAGKWREISEPLLWPDQCVHHALIQPLEPVMMRGMDNWCCGSIKGRGAHYGIKAIKKWMLRKDTPYCIEADIYHFYDSIKPEHVINRMLQLIKDRKTIDLIWRVVKDGVTIGSYCSQWFANALLQPLDQLIRQSGATHYLRYMDNFTIFTKRKRTAGKIIKIIGGWLNGLGLRLKGNFQYFHVKYRLPNALGYRFGRGYTLMRKKNVLRLKKQLRRFYKLYASGRFITVKFAQSLLSRLGQLRWCNSVKIYKENIKKHTQKKLKEVIRKWQKGVRRWSIRSAPEHALA